MEMFLRFADFSAALKLKRLSLTPYETGCLGDLAKNHAETLPSMHTQVEATGQIDFADPCPTCPVCSLQMKQTGTIDLVCIDCIRLKRNAQASNSQASSMYLLQ